jgi:hypothetical protein
LPKDAWGLQMAGAGCRNNSESDRENDLSTIDDIAEGI